jgi:hypothetical protein
VNQLSQVDTIELQREDGTRYRFVGERAASVSSHREAHTHQFADRERPQYAPRGERCSACRWIEVLIYLVNEWLDGADDEGNSGRYLVVTRGMTVVPGEREFRRTVATDSPYEVVELLTVRRNHSGRDDAYIPSSNARALSRAAELDGGIRDAYLNRAVQ